MAAIGVALAQSQLPGRPVFVGRQSKRFSVSFRRRALRFVSTCVARPDLVTKKTKHKRENTKQMAV